MYLFCIGMLHAVIGPTRVNALLASLNVLDRVLDDKTYDKQMMKKYKGKIPKPRIFVIQSHTTKENKKVSVDRMDQTGEVPGKTCNECCLLSHFSTC